MVIVDSELTTEVKKVFYQPSVHPKSSNRRAM